MEKLNISQAKSINLVHYLSELGHQPVKVRGNDYWYLSPLRNEHTASFKVNNKRNVWYDHGIGKGGDIITFGTLYFNCSISDLLQKLSNNTLDSFFQPQKANVLKDILDYSKRENKADSAGKIIITQVRNDIMNASLIRYLKQRQISLAIAQSYCREVDFQLYGKQRTAVGFQNNSEGFELRSASFKGSSSPKDVKLFTNNGAKLTVFEGFFDFLSYIQSLPKTADEKVDFLVLNSLAFFEKSKAVMDKYPLVDLFLDNDKSGQDCVLKAKEWNSEQYQDQSHLYRPYKDLNEQLCIQSSKKRKLRSGKRL